MRYEVEQIDDKTWRYNVTGVEGVFGYRSTRMEATEAARADMRLVRLFLL